MMSQPLKAVTAALLMAPALASKCPFGHDKKEKEEAMETGLKFAEIWS